MIDAAGRPLGDAWPLRTFPDPQDKPDKLRLAIYTCAGGHDINGTHLPISTRVRLLKRALSFAPDALIANGDHVYWDLRTARAKQSGASPKAEGFAGRFDRVAPVLGNPNEAVLKRAVGPQIVPLYGVLCRSTPVFFLQDDHDYFENDEADDRFVSFPPDPFMLAAARASQKLYYPEFLPDANRPRACHQRALNAARVERGQMGRVVRRSRIRRAASPPRNPSPTGRRDGGPSTIACCRLRRR